MTEEVATSPFKPDEGDEGAPEGDEGVPDWTELEEEFLLKKTESRAGSVPAAGGAGERADPGRIRLYRLPMLLGSYSMVS